MRIGFRFALLSALLMIPAGALASSFFGSSGGDTRPDSPQEPAPGLVTIEGELTVRPDLLLLPLRLAAAEPSQKATLAKAAQGKH